jgi:hypothetical protein
MIDTPSKGVYLDGKTRKEVGINPNGLVSFKKW